MVVNEPDSWHLQTWCDGFYGIYQINDKKRTLAHFWLQVSNDASKVAEAVRRQKYELAMYNIGNAFCWMCCFVERLKEDIKKLPNETDILKVRGKTFQEWILYRYPFRCHHCGYPLCHCVLFSETMEERKDAHKDAFEKMKEGVKTRLTEGRKELEKYSKLEKIPLKELFKGFNVVYGNKVFSSSIEDLTFHYLEEVGEVGHVITVLETLVGHNDADELDNKIKDDPELKLEDHFKKDEWDEAFKQAKKSKQGNTDVILALEKLEGNEKRNQVAAASICYMIMDEIADVFSWTTAIINKIERLGKKYSITEVFEGADWIPEEKNGKKYLYGTGPVKEFRCPYCVEPSCKTWCPLRNILTTVSESQVKGN